MSRIILNISTKNALGEVMKVYDYGGRKNICGNRVREARVRRKLTQEELAAKLQVEGLTLERDSVSRIEIGTRFVADFELVVLSKVLNVDLKWLATLDGPDAEG